VRDSTTVLRYEIKFSINETQAQQVLDWAVRYLTLDSHATNAEEGTYRTKTLYLDTELQDVYHRRGSYKHHKFRVRRYGNEPFVFLERKSRWFYQVDKYRTVIAESELPLLGSYPLSSRWEGSWFHRQILSGGLKPSYQIGYERTAYVGNESESPMRLTMDRKIGSRPAHGWRFAESEGLPLFGDRVILEMKYRNLLPLQFQNLIRSLGLTLGRISKYRLAVQASERIGRHGKLWLPYG
jgi:hypothetical protein